MRWLSIVALVMLSACVASGVQVKPEQTAKLQKGKTTYAEAVQALGKPTTVSTASDGTLIAVYNYVESQARPESFIPIVGAFAGGADSRINMVMLTFGPDGVLKDWHATETNTGTGYGVEAGKTTTTSTGQPTQAP